MAPEIESRGTTALRRHNEALHQLGRRWLLLADSQQQLIGELRSVLTQATATFDAADSPEALRDRAFASAREATAVLDWCAATLQEMRDEAAAAAEGRQRVDALGLCQDVVHDLGLTSDRHFMVTGSARSEAVGDVAALEQLVRLAVELVGQRAAGWSDIHVTVSDGRHGPSIAVAGVDGARGEPDPTLVADFRAAVGSTRARCEPDESGREGTGLVLHLPSADPHS